MLLLLGLHRFLQEIGRFIGVLTLLGLLCSLAFIPVAAILLAALYGAREIELLTGWGAPVFIPIFFLIIGLAGCYVAPTIQPQIGAALAALSKPNWGHDN